MKTYLEFEKDIKDLEEELEKLKDPFNKEGLSEVETDKISTIQNQIDEKLKIFPKTYKKDKLKLQALLFQKKCLFLH